MAVEHALEVAPNSLTTFLQSDQASASSFRKELNMGPDRFELALGYINGPDHEQSSRGKDATDVFHAGTPGTLSLEELEETVNLAQWRLKLGPSLVRLEVYTSSYWGTIPMRLLLICVEQNLSGWDESEISDTWSIKGIAAELAACIGPELVKKTALHFR